MLFTFRSALLGFLLALGAMPAVAQERITFMSNGAPMQLDGILSRPSGDGPFPALVLLPGCDNPSSFRQTAARYERWSEYLRGQGYTVLLVGGAGDACNQATAYGALRFLQVLPFVRADRIGAIGWSQGAAALLWAVDDEGAVMRPRDLRYNFAAAVSFNPDCRAAVEREPPWRTWTPLIILTGEKDEPAPVASCLELVKWSRLDGEPVNIADEPEALQRVPAFLSRYLQH